MKRLLAALFAVFCLPGFAFAQEAMSDYLDVFTVKVRPEKQADFEAIGRRIADANRKAKGDLWLAMEVVYGEGNTVQIVSARQNYAAIDSANTAFMNAIKSGYGPGGLPQMMADLNSTVLSARSEIRRRRWDLTVNTPPDINAYNKIVGESRWLRTLRISVRNGHENDFEERVKEAKAALEKGSKWTYFISEVVAGAPGSTYYVSTLQPSLAAFDSAPKLSELMGKEAYAAWEKGVSEATNTTETIIMRALPDLSNAPEGIVKVAPDFWQSKRTASTMHTNPELAKTAKAAQ